MTNRQQAIPKHAKDAADRGELILAIQITQDTLGMKLQEAQQAVHAYLKRAAPGRVGTFDTALPPQALASLQRGNRIEAIKHTREATGLGLKESKDLVERYVAQNPQANAPVEGGTRGGSNFAPLLATLVLVAVGAAAALWFSAGQ